jgi:hypothetical protein
MKFGCTETLTLSRAMEIANRYANGEEEDRPRSGKSRAGDANQSDNNKGKKHKRKAEAAGNAEATALAGQGKGSQKQKKDFFDYASRRRIGKGRSKSPRRVTSLINPAKSTQRKMRRPI